MTETRMLAAIPVANVLGCSRLVGADEERTLARLRGLRSDLIDRAIAAHHGRMVKRAGDGAAWSRRRTSPETVESARAAVGIGAATCREQ
jgi:class 3 adenylate cyclase